MPTPDEMRAINEKFIAEFRANGGVSDDRPLLLLTTTGARTGLTRTTPMMFVPDGERLLVIASNAGAPRDPDWFHNLVAYPDVTVEVTGDTFEATATVLLDEEREPVFAEIVRLYPFFAEHQARAGRDIPVVALTRRR
jgi:deazaflavin-dependent oxidoreductase (nitroreductase family)